MTIILIIIIIKCEKQCRGKAKRIDFRLLFAHSRRSSTSVVHTHEIRTKKFSLFPSFVCDLANVLFALCGERFGMLAQRAMYVSVDFGCLSTWRRWANRQSRMFTFGQKVLLSQSECETDEKCQVQSMGGFVHLFFFLFRFSFSVVSSRCALQRNRKCCLDSLTNFEISIS